MGYSVPLRAALEPLLPKIADVIDDGFLRDLDSKRIANEILALVDKGEALGEVRWVNASRVATKEIQMTAPQPMSSAELDRLRKHWSADSYPGLKAVFDMAVDAAELATKVYQPGVFKCAKCGFQLVQSSLNANTGSVTARDAVGEKCPNDGSPMWRVSYQEDNAKAWEWDEAQFDRATKAEAEALAVGERVGALEAALAQIIAVAKDGAASSGLNRRVNGCRDILEIARPALQANPAKEPT